MRSALAAAFIILVQLLAFSRVENDNNFRQRVANRGQEEKSRSVDQLLMEIERDWASAIIASDAEKIREILAPEVVLTTPDGTVLNREDDLAELVRRIQSRSV